MQVNNFWKFEAYTKFFTFIKLMLNKICNFGSILEIGHFGPQMGIQFISYNGKRISDKKFWLTRLKSRQLN